MLSLLTQFHDKCLIRGFIAFQVKSSVYSVSVPRCGCICAIKPLPRSSELLEPPLDLTVCSFVDYFASWNRV
jgi:hypothetical protein